MATYVYETVPIDPSQPRRRFEVQQSMKEAPLVRDPQTGESVRRVISGGYGFIGAGKGDKAGAAGVPAPTVGGGGCGHSCGCGHSH